MDAPEVNGRGGEPEWGPESRTLAYRLCGAAVGDDDLYAMVNASPDDQDFVVENGAFVGWRRAIDTSLPDADDLRAAGEEVPLRSPEYRVGAHSVVVLVRRRA